MREKTSKRVPLPGQEHMAFPKMKRVKIRPKECAPKVPEKDIQDAVDAVIEAYGICALRLPDAMFRAIYQDRGISDRMRSWILHTLGGWSDNVLFFPLAEYEGVKFNLAVHIENKTATGKLEGKQKVRAAELGYNICRDAATAQSIIETSKKFLALLRGPLLERAMEKKAEPTP